MKNTIEPFIEKITKNLEEITPEIKRLFHGRGCMYEKFEFISLDSIDTILYLAFYSEVDKKLENEILAFLHTLTKTHHYKTIILQRRYLKAQTIEVVYGSLPQKSFGIEHGLKYELDFSGKQNIGLFFDMKNGRDFILKNSYGKNVLNLFSYTCAFSVCAIKGGAKKTVNFDMSKSALSIGRNNHHINDLSTQNVKFFPHNILKSWNKIKRDGPYDMIIIDPPSFQKNSFAASNDYEKIIKRIDDFLAKDGMVLSCLNDPMLDTNFIKNLFFKFAPSLKYIKRLENIDEFDSKDEEKSLKNMLFIKK